MDKEISHFWLGYFKNEEDFYDFVEEDESYYADEWLPVLEQKLNELSLDTPVNAIIFASRFVIPNPVSVDGEENKLYYIGEIEFNV